MNFQLRKITLFSILVLSVLISGCRKDDEDTSTGLDEQLQQAMNISSNGIGESYYILPSSTDFDAIPQDPNNPLTSKKVELGMLLYHETGLSISPMMDLGEGQFSCASCHFASAGFQANRVQGLSEGGMGFGINGEGRVKNPFYPEDSLDVQPLRSPSVMNNAYQSNLLWNGQFGATGINTGTDAYWTPGTPIAINELGYEGLETQAIAGLSVHRMNVDLSPSIIQDLGYKEMFDEVFSDFPELERYSTETTGLAIAAYERTILSNQAPFQKYLKGETNALSEQEKRGALLFFDNAGCTSCHNGPGFNNMEFHALGLKDLHENSENIFKTVVEDPAHKGRGSFTGLTEDEYKFKVPQLYNLSDSPFYGHGASIRSIRDMIEYKNLATAENSNVPSTQLAEDFKPLNLSNQQIDDIVAFLELSLHDPNLTRFEPEALPSGNCFPFNDQMAREDLGCN